MSVDETGTGHADAGAHGAAQPPSLAELEAMTPEQRMIAGAELDGIHIVHRRERFPIRGTKAEKRAERAVAACFTISGLCGIAFIVYFCAGPWHWHLPGSPQNFKYFTPVLGGTMAGLLLFMGVGMVLWAKWLMPEEEVIQERHDDPSTDEDLALTEASFVVGLDDTGLPRRSLILRSLGIAGGALAAVPLVALVGGMIRKPGDQLLHTMFRPRPHDPAFAKTGGLIPIVRSDWTYFGPGDLAPGGIETVFPGVRAEDENGFNGLTSASSPTILIRLRPGQTITFRKGQEHFGWPADNPEFVAFSKICTHAGCPASLYEQQTSRLLCPCHQSQFDVLEDAKPVFGPATRSLPQLPIEVLVLNGQQIFVAKSDYVEPIGPGFWERK